jgi:hypothetical protein
MDGPIARAVLAVFLPIVVFIAGVLLMSAVTGREYVAIKLAASMLPDEDRIPLNKRSRGYDAQEVERLWNAFDDRARSHEITLLQIDLVFPLLYAAAFLASLVLLWRYLDLQWPIAVVILPIGLLIISDWTENLALLHELSAGLWSRALAR